MSVERYRQHILIVDDSPANLHMLGSILGDHYNVLYASGGEEGIRLANTRAIDLILLDVVMPDMDGYNVCNQLKTDPATRNIPVIFLTSLTSAADEEKGLSAGAEDFIHKPVSPPVVMARVRNHLLLANSKRELRSQNEQLEKLVVQRTGEIVRKDHQLIAAQSATITAFCALAEARDNETGNHIRRTQNYVRLLAEKMRNHPRYRPLLTDESIELLYKSAPLHDIGKVAIPDAILLKPGRLTEEEWVVMKKHSLVGRDAITTAASELDRDDGNFLSFAAEIAYTHHERWDGKGYPRALAGDAIPLSGRLMAVADVYDALTTKRVYKEALSHKMAITIMKAERGSHFDPDIFDAMIAIQDQFQGIARQYGDAIAPAKVPMENLVVL